VAWKLTGRVCAGGGDAVQLIELFEELRQQKELLEPPSKRKKQQKEKGKLNADVCTLGDAWLAPAIREGLIMPLPGGRDQAAWWGGLPPRLKQLACRDARGRPDPNGALWGLPYRWGCVLFAYRVDKLKQNRIAPPHDWCVAAAHR
jgi:spermidine/putrescine-binding protein